MDLAPGGKLVTDSDCNIIVVLANLMNCRYIYCICPELSELIFNQIMLAKLQHLFLKNVKCYAVSKNQFMHVYIVENDLQTMHQLCKNVFPSLLKNENVNINRNRKMCEWYKWKIIRKNIYIKNDI